MKLTKIVSIFLLWIAYSNTFVYAASTDANVLLAFSEINKALYNITETRDYCNANFKMQTERNNEAYDEWELQYSFFLKEYDSNYAKWKSGFTPQIQQQLIVQENILKRQTRLDIEEEYKDGGRDKCFTFKPSLGRPRNNLELSYQDQVNLIRNNTLNNFADARNQVNTQPFCAWQQEHALKVSDSRNQGKDEKAQKIELKDFKKQINSDNKNFDKMKINAYGDMISEIYEAEQLQNETFSLYRLNLCEREYANFENPKFKHILPNLIECQNSSAGNSELLNKCIYKALDKE